ncbi:MAG: hypothetical protein ABIR22_10835, partial [Candidatus Eisenbacteria bacterium]
MNLRNGNSVVAETQVNVVAAIQGATNVAGALVEVMTGMVVHALRAGEGPRKEVQEAATGTITGALQGLTQVGNEPGAGSRAIMTGVLRGAQRVGRITSDLVDECADTLVRETYVVGGDVTRAAKGAVEGAIDSARETGTSVEVALAAATKGAMRGAAAIGNFATRDIQKMLAGTIAGVNSAVGGSYR